MPSEYFVLLVPRDQQARKEVIFLPVSEGDGGPTMRVGRSRYGAQVTQLTNCDCHGFPGGTRGKEPTC